MSVWVGVDVGGTTTRVGVAGSAGGIAQRASTPTPRSAHDLITTISSLCYDLGVTDGADGVGVGLPGVVTAEGATWVPNVPGLESATLAADISAQMNAPVTLGNDAQLALLGEARDGAAHGFRSALLISLGTGIGGALLLAGRLVRGAHGSAGAMGWLVVDSTVDGTDEGVDNRDNDRGNLERLAAGPAWNEAAAKLEPPRDSRWLVLDARSGDRAAMAVIQRLGRDLGAAIASVGSVFDPEVIVISGGLSDAFDLLQTPIDHAIQNWGSPQLRLVPVRAAALGDDAGLVGAAYAAQEGDGAWW
jgi:predicted NBD/HSP70 family sugar kinase